MMRKLICSQQILDGVENLQTTSESSFTRAKVKASTTISVFARLFKQRGALVFMHVHKVCGKKIGGGGECHVH